MTLISLHQVRCVKCKTIYERPELVSISFHDENDVERVARYSRDSEKKCPKCNESEVVDVTFSFKENVLLFLGLKVIERYEPYPPQKKEKRKKRN